MTYEGRLERVALFSLGKRKLRGDMITIFKYVKGYRKEKGYKLFISTGDMTRSNGLKVLQGDLG